MIKRILVQTKKVMINKLKIDLNRFKKLFVLLMFVVSFMYFGVFRYLIIPSGDDYFWGGKQGNYLIHHMFMDHKQFMAAAVMAAIWEIL